MAKDYEEGDYEKERIIVWEERSGKIMGDYYNPCLWKGI